MVAADITAAGVFATTVADGPADSSHTLTDIVQGVAEQRRVGRKCTITSIHMRLLFEKIASSLSSLNNAVIAHETVRIMLYWDKQCNGTAATALQLIETDQYNQFRNLSNSKRFVMLYDRTFSWNFNVVGAGNGTDNDSEIVVKEYNVRVNKKVFIPIEFDNTTGALSGIRSNNIGLIFWGKHGGRMELDSTSRIRLRFIDY